MMIMTVKVKLMMEKTTLLVQVVIISGRINRTLAAKKMMMSLNLKMRKKLAIAIDLN